MSYHISEEHFQRVLEDVTDQVFGQSGKGYKRHGLGVPVEWQPAFIISRKIGPEFLIGQAVKKLMELKVKTDRAWRQEALGAVVYTVFAIMWHDYIENSNAKEEQDPSTERAYYQDERPQEGSG